MGNYFCQCTNQQNNSFLSPQKLQIYEKFLRQYSDIYTPETFVSDSIVTSNISKLTSINFEPQKFLGAGCFGNVVAVKKIRVQNGKVFALKIINKNAIKEKILLHSDIFQHNIISKNNPFLTSVYQVFQNQMKIFILMEYIPAGDLLFYIKKSNGFDEETIKEVAAEILFGLKYFHQQGIIYRGLKPQNVLVSTDGHIKLTDYWSSKKIDQLDQSQQFSGTIQYTAPQILKKRNYDQKSDFWSFGMLLFQMRYGKTALDEFNNSEQNIMNSIYQGLYQIDQRCSEQLKDLLTKLLSSELSCRPTISDIQNHPFFSGINWNFVSQRQNQPLLQKLVKKYNTRQQRASYLKPKRLFKIGQNICQNAIYQFNYFSSN